MQRTESAMRRASVAPSEPNARRDAASSCSPSFDPAWKMKNSVTSMNPKTIRPCATRLPKWRVIAMKFAPCSFCTAGDDSSGIARFSVHQDAIWREPVGRRLSQSGIGRPERSTSWNQ